MLKTISFLSISVHHILVSYWPFLAQSLSHSPSLSNFINDLKEISQNFVKRVKIIYQNSMMGFMIGLGFFHLMPLANTQIKLAFFVHDGKTLDNIFPYGTLTAILAFVFVLANSNYFYHTNSAKTVPKRGNFRSRSQFQHEMLSNKKLQIKRRLALQNFSTQFMISLPSILLTSSLAAENSAKIWFWCLLMALFEKQYICSYFGKSYYAAGLQKQQARKLIFAHLAINLLYLLCCCVVILLFPIMTGILNGISCGIIIYDVMIQKLAHHYEEKKNLRQKILFFVAGIILSSLIISQ